MPGTRLNAGMTSSSRIIPVILCGGAGTRLWPVSQRTWPKPLVALAGPETMLQATAQRTADTDRFEAPIIVTAAAYAEAASAQLEEAGTAPQLTIVEPCARNTAAAIALAALNVAAEALILVLPSDHVIADKAAFAKAIDTAAAAAADGWLVTFGVTPDRPETGYGYIHQAETVGEGVFRVERFAEKPDASVAQAWIDQGGWSWNAGIFLMGAGDFLSALAEHDPDILSAAQGAVARQERNGRSVQPDGDILAASPARSVDHAVMEHSSKVAVVPVEMGWSDVGSWEAVHSIGQSDEAGNVVSGDVLSLGTQDCLIRSDGPTIVAIGVSDLVIVATKDQLLVVPRSQSQRVKEAVELLEARESDKDR